VTPSPSRAPLTWQQVERQRTRERNGRYAALNPCELCGKACGAEYFSDPRVNDRLKGYGLFLHEKCAARIASLSEELAIAALKEAERTTTR
jgi:hypothetical protein